LDKNIDHITVLVDSPPEIFSLKLDSHKQFIQVPRVAQAALSSPKYSGVFATKLSTPLSDGFVHCDAARRQKIFHISEA
jgi:hypothetical protein